MEIKTLDQFTATKKVMSIEEYAKVIGWHVEDFTGKDLSVYDDGFYIENHKDGTHSLLLERSEYSGGLEELEVLLWDWAKWEITPMLSYNELYDDIWNRAHDFLNEIGQKCSLDELEIDSLTLAERQKQLYLLNEFEEIETHGQSRKLEEKPQEIEVFFENKSGAHKIATFQDEEVYKDLVSSLQVVAKRKGYDRVTETVN